MANVNIVQSKHLGGLITSATGYNMVAIDQSGQKIKPMKRYQTENIIKHNVHYYKQPTDPRTGLT